MSRVNIILLVLILLLTGCKKKENDEMPVIQEEEQGAIFITVAFNGQPVSGAVVSTDPETSVGTTSGTGSVMIKNVPEGIYQIVASKEGIGSGSGVVDLDKGAKWLFSLKPECSKVPWWILYPFPHRIQT